MDLTLYFTTMDPSFPSKSLGSILFFSKICGLCRTHSNYAIVDQGSRDSGFNGFI